MRNKTFAVIPFLLSASLTCFGLSSYGARTPASVARAVTTRAQAVAAVRFKELSDRGAPEGESSQDIRARVLAARARQAERFRGSSLFSNAQMSPRLIRRHCRLDAEGEQLLEQAMTRQGLSARAYDRILKVSRTIADLEASDNILPRHVSEAVGYRSLDRTYWT